MTSFVVSFFLLVSLISSNSATPPTGLKVRITENAKDVLKHLGLTYLNGLVNKPFDFQFLYGRTTFTIKGLTLTDLQVDPAQVDFKFQQNNGLQFEIKDVNFAVELQRKININLFRELRIDRGNTTLRGAGVSATIVVRLNRSPEGGLNVEIPKDNCKIKADSIRTTSTGILGRILDLLKRLTTHLFNKKICPALEPMINEKLKDKSMRWNVHEGRQLYLDYSLSNDIAVTSRSLDVSFKGLVSVQGQDVETGLSGADKEIIFTKTDHMIYVGISEFFFSGPAMSLYKAGPFNFNIPQFEGLKSLLNNLLNTVGLSPGPVNVELTEAPTIKISKAGFSAKGTMKIQSQGQVRLVACQLDITVDLKEKNLFLKPKDPKCEFTPKTIIGSMVVNAAKFFLGLINMLFNGIRLPLPAEMNFIEANVQYEDGYLVAGGSLTFNPQQGSSRNAER